MRQRTNFAPTPSTLSGMERRLTLADSVLLVIDAQSSFYGERA